MTAVQPMSATLRAKLATFGVIPGISAITITAGPLPFLNTILVSPSCVKVPASKSRRSSSAMGRA
ncbi:Uncharacterised protein [Mycobacteroides abscessus subsp. massiliense]|nr:Uncharacterised protein [Mycobacteroides abscessus subsp. massiliense]